uniref:RanBP2-type domain-containing protein n=1 Tax=Falco tinnunculus TaxID=100819 RepID=A0A8C4UP34_FALTI
MGEETDPTSLQPPAIEYGDEEAASQCAVALARQQATLSILWKETNYPTDHISVASAPAKMQQAAVGKLWLWVHLQASPAAQVFHDYGFHPLVQRWIIGQCLCVDERTVSSYGIRRDGDIAFLYLLSAKMAELTEERYEEDQKGLALRPPCGHQWGGQPRSCPGPRALPQRGVPDHVWQRSPAGWSCPKCTFINKPTRPGCEMCSTDRPEDYVVPGSYKPDETELWRMQQEQEGILQYQQVRGLAVHCGETPRSPHPVLKDRPREGRASGPVPARTRRPPALP